MFYSYKLVKNCLNILQNINIIYYKQRYFVVIIATDVAYIKSIGMLEQTFIDNIIKHVCV